MKKNLPLLEGYDLPTHKIGLIGMVNEVTFGMTVCVIITLDSKLSIYEDWLKRERLLRPRLWRAILTRKNMYASIKVTRNGRCWGRYGDE